MEISALDAALADIARTCADIERQGIVIDELRFGAADPEKVSRRTVTGRAPVPLVGLLERRNTILSNLSGHRRSREHLATASD